MRASWPCQQRCLQKGWPARFVEPSLRKPQAAIIPVRAWRRHRSRDCASNTATGNRSWPFFRRPSGRRLPARWCNAARDFRFGGGRASATFSTIGICPDSRPAARRLSRCRCRAISTGRCPMVTPRPRWQERLRNLPNPRTHHRKTIPPTAMPPRPAADGETVRRAGLLSAGGFP